ncbi:dual OB domain-containing protein [Dyella kyungheensis]|uniref:Dual OB-containing domain-containing protein n=1 Tax=Dyella kyungheensis TaxID=1242174 RepID=A0ABS2JQ92_9GAMM|nr:hypothetical protein [Dyella kyungheensis]MBM7120218.1 hypothetical protein [Dyella kyungheensis]
MVTKKILCLANSKKMAGRCIAGRQIVNGTAGPWIRPISDRPTQEVSEYERQYADGTDPRVLDIINVPLVEHQPHACQTENWLLEPHEYWEKVGQASWLEAENFAESPRTLWHNGDHTVHGLNDRVATALADALPQSLHLIRVPAVELRIFAPGANRGVPKRKVQAKFAYNGVNYWISVTDPHLERQYLARENGTYPLGESLVCVSLGEPFEGHRYKLAAAIIQRAQVQ